MYLKIFFTISVMIFILTNVVFNSNDIDSRRSKTYRGIQCFRLLQSVCSGRRHQTFVRLIFFSKNTTFKTNCTRTTFIFHELRCLQYPKRRTRLPIKPPNTNPSFYFVLTKKMYFLKTVNERINPLNRLLSVIVQNSYQKKEGGQRSISQKLIYVS